MVYNKRKRSLMLKKTAAVAVCAAFVAYPAYGVNLDDLSSGEDEPVSLLDVLIENDEIDNESDILDIITASEEAPPKAEESVEETMTTGTVTADILNVRETPGTDKPIVGKLYAGQAVYITDTDDVWYYIENANVTGWVHSDYVEDITTITMAEYQAKLESGKAKADEILTFAKQYIGSPYRAGGSGPSGFDCSGFVSYVFNNFGMSLPRSSSSYAYIGTPVSMAEIQPGDIICFNTSGYGISHVGIYVGNDQFIHASTSYRGVVINPIYNGYFGSRIVTIVRVL